VTSSIAALEGRPTSAMAESDLIAAYRLGLAPVIRICPCACGETLQAPNGDEPAIAVAVAVHNESTAHQQWRARNAG